MIAPGHAAMTTLELIRMARRGEEDGHDRDWYAHFTSSPRLLALMHQAANEAYSTSMAEVPAGAGATGT